MMRICRFLGGGAFLFAFAIPLVCAIRLAATPVGGCCFHQCARETYCKQFPYQKCSDYGGLNQSWCESHEGAKFEFNYFECAGAAAQGKNCVPYKVEGVTQIELCYTTWPCAWSNNTCIDNQDQETYYYMPIFTSETCPE